MLGGMGGTEDFDALFVEPREVASGGEGYAKRGEVSKPRRLDAEAMIGVEAFQVVQRVGRVGAEEVLGLS